MDVGWRVEDAGSCCNGGVHADDDDDDDEHDASLMIHTVGNL